MPQIIPAILTESPEILKNQLQKTRGLFPYVQLDIMDGEFVSGRSVEAEVTQSLEQEISFELHLMVNDPVAEMRKWQKADNVFRVIFHAESPTDAMRVISFARKEGWEIGVALNPDTELETVRDLISRVDLVQFMTVYPGRQGAPFEEKVLKKISQYQNLRNKPICSVDGGVNFETVSKLKELEIEIFNIGSALMLSEDIAKTKKDFEEKLTK